MEILALFGFGQQFSSSVKDRIRRNYLMRRISL